jgi:hypothetical protein
MVEGKYFIIAGKIENIVHSVTQWYVKPAKRMAIHNWEIILEYKSS